MTVPPVVERIGRTDLLSLPDVAEELALVVRRHGTLYEWAAAAPQPRALRGRAPVYMAQLPASRGSVVVRHAWHGGLLAPLTRDLFWPPTRAPLELAQSMALRAAGVPTTEILGVARYPAAMGFVRVDVVSRYLEGTHDLGAVLAGQDETMSLDMALVATRQLLVTLAMHRVLHPDLNVKNILLRQGDAGVAEAWVIDIDVVRFPVVRPASELLEQNLARLLRSMRKWRAQCATALSDAQLERFPHDVREAWAAHVA